MLCTVCTGVCVLRAGWVWTPVYLEGQKKMLGVRLSLCLSPLKQGLLLNPEQTNHLILQPLSLTQGYASMCTAMPTLFYCFLNTWELGSRLRSSCFHGKHSYPLSHLFRLREFEKWNLYAGGGYKDNSLASQKPWLCTLERIDFNFHKKTNEMPKPFCKNYFISLNAKAGVCSKNYSLWHQEGRQDGRAKGPCTKLYSLTPDWSPFFLLPGQTC